MNFFFALILLLIGLFLPVFAGVPLVRWLGIAASSLERFILAFLFGWLFFCAIFAIAGFANFGFNLLGGISIIFLIWLVFFCLFRSFRHDELDGRADKVRKKESKVAKVIRYLLICLGTVLFLLIFIDSVGNTDSMPMQAVWGYKAKVFYLEGRLPLSFFLDPNIPFTHQSYPLLFPLMLTWSYFWMGGVYEPMLKIVAPLLGVFLYLSLYDICRKEGSSTVTSLILATLFCGGMGFFISSTVLYSENLMLLYILWGSYFIYRYIKESIDSRESLSLLISGFLLLAGGASVKNEGLIYFTIATVFVIMMHLIRILRTIIMHKESGTENLKKELIKAIRAVIVGGSVSLLFIVPWLLFRYHYDIEVRDFSLTEKLKLIFKEGFVHSGSYEVLKQSISKFANAMFIDVTVSCGLWYFLILLLLRLRKKMFRKENLFLLLMIFLPVAIFAVSFIFSTRMLDWHLNAVPRLLLAPLLISCLMIFVNRACPLKLK